MLFIGVNTQAQQYNFPVTGIPAFLQDSMPAIPHVLVYNANINPQTVTLPQGIKYCIIEVWGGGGCGGANRGGGGGGYVIAKLRNVGGKTIQITVGSGGRLGNFLYFNGKGSSVSIDGSTFAAAGGSGDIANPSSFGNYVINNTNPNFTAYGLIGEPGKPNRSADFSVRNDTTIVVAIRGGRGGSGGNSPNSGGEGNSLYAVAKYDAKPSPNGSPKNFVNLVYYQFLQGNFLEQADNGKLPGGGGGGVVFRSTGFALPDPNKGTPGGDGLIIIYY